jgi:protein phosphatase
MGGAAAGDLASSLAATSIYEALTAQPDASRAGHTSHTAESRHPGAASRTRRHGTSSHADTHRLFAQDIRHAVEFANTRLFQTAERDPRLYGMGTTATVAGILDDVLYLAQIGDSRAYLVRRGIAYQLTRDQSRVQALVDAGVLTPEEAARSSERHIILQALGPEPRVSVVLTRQQQRPGDVVVLSPHGQHGGVYDAVIAARAARPDPAAACQALVDLGNKRGGPDNITVVIMHLSGAELAEPQEEDIVGRQVVS